MVSWCDEGVKQRMNSILVHLWKVGQYRRDWKEIKDMQPCLPQNPRSGLVSRWGLKLWQVPLSCNETSKQIRILDSFSALSFLCSFFESINILNTQFIILFTLVLLAFDSWYNLFPRVPSIR